MLRTVLSGCYLTGVRIKKFTTGGFVMCSLVTSWPCDELTGSPTNSWVKWLSCYPVLKCCMMFVFLRRRRDYDLLIVRLKVWMQLVATVSNCLSLLMKTNFCAIENQGIVIGEKINSLVHMLQFQFCREFCVSWSMARTQPVNVF